MCAEISSCHLLTNIAKAEIQGFTDHLQLSRIRAVVCTLYVV